MDHDDNDFQGQNLQLAGEGNSNFSPVLRPYALPKFDFDDSLQGHLRFDSLVENEVFLGIPSQEDNQWIEDFSRGNSGIEFSSTAAESCSISRRNNVWSEATSSESVEMLLKSVGQGEMMVPGETIIEESDGGDELGSLTDQMEPDLRLDDKIEDVTDSNLREVGNLDPSVSEKCGVTVSEENLVIDRTDDSNRREVDNSVNESPNKRVQEDPSDSGILIGSTDFDSQNVIASVGQLDDKEVAHQVDNISFENAHDLPKDCKGADEQNIQSQEANMDDQILSGDAVEPVKNHAVETTIDKFEEISSLPVMGDCDVQSAEGSSKDVFSTVSSLGKGTDVTEQFEGNAHEESPVVFQRETSFEEHDVEVVSDKGQSSSIPDENFHDSETQMDNKPCKEVDGISICNLARVAECSSAELVREEPTIHNIEDGDSAPSVHKDSNAEVQICEDNTFSEHGDVHKGCEVVSLLEKGNSKLPNDSSEMECEAVASTDSDKRVKEALPSGENIEDNVVKAHGAEFDTTTEDEPVDIASGSGAATTDEVTDHSEEQKSPAPGTGLTHQDKQEEVEVGVPISTSLSILKESSQVESRLDSVSRVEKGASVVDCAAQNVHEPVDQLVPIVGTCKASTKSEQSAVANEVGQDCSEKMEMCPTPHDSADIMGDNAEAVASRNKDEITVERDQKLSSLKVLDELPIPNKNEVVTEPASVTSVKLCADVVQRDYEANQTAESDSQPVAANTRVDPIHSSEVDAIHTLEGGGNSADSDKANCGSPTVISCIEISYSDRDNKHEGVKGPTVESIPLSHATDRVDDKVQSNSKENDASKEEKSFTFEVNPLVVLSEGETGKGWQSFPSVQACKITTIEGSPSTSGGAHIDFTIAQKTPPRTPQANDGGSTRGGSKGTSERKPRRSSGKSAGKESARKGNQMKEKTPAKESDRGDKSSVPTSLLGTGQLVQSEELKPYGNVERSGAKAGGVISVPTSNLPDLNTSLPSPAALFQQPFTDVQQVQLRAQIFVYGSLIQGAAPDEACMVSAFGPSDGGRTVWEPKWRAYLDRLHGQKSTANNSESPVQPRSGTSRTPDQAIKHGSSHQSKVLPSPVGRPSSKGTTPSSPVVTPMIPLSSPLWNVSTPSCDGLQSGVIQRNPLLDYHQALSPLNPYQAPPPVRNYVGHSPSWLSQASFPGPWIASPQNSSFDVGARFSRFPITEAVKLTPVKESSAPVSSSTKHLSPIPVAHSVGPSVFDVQKVTVSPGQHSTEPKSRKRKKVPVTEDLGPISLPTQTPMESASASVVGGHFSKKIAVTEDIGHMSLLPLSKQESVSTPVVNTHFSTSVAVTSNSGKSLPVLSPTSSTDHAKQGHQNAEKGPTEGGVFNEVEQAKIQAEEAATHAAAAVNHCEGVWSQLDKQKNSGLVLDIEAKLASAAVAIAAAASVAKAAAAAAKIASNAAIQAKLMVEEALASSGTLNPTQSTTISIPNTPATILKVGDGSKSSSSIILAAREAARKRVEAASAASKHAENLDAIVKAAELAAEAVSQAGKIVSMGDPLPLSELLAFGPEGYGDQFKTNKVEKSPNVSAKQPNEGPSDKEMATTSHGEPPLVKEISKYLEEGHLMDGISGTVTGGEMDSRGHKGRRVSELAKTIGVVPESEFGSLSTSDIGQDEHEKEMGSSNENGIKQGCLVEVLKDGANGKAGWFSARVLRLKDEKAFVGYTELKSDKGQLQEWVTLEDQRNKAPRIRIAHPMTSMHSDGTRKRRRAALTDYAWSVGDKVDAWIEDCWCEGFVTEKSQKDETTLTVRFSAQGEKSVKAWDLRPTLVYKDGEWIEWSGSRIDRPSQGDTPKEKRFKLGSPIEDKGKDKTSRNNNQVEPEKHDESRLLPLSLNEKAFNVGKNSRGDGKLDALGPMRTGFQASGVNIGVPKPGKKRKFMAVSKHYISESSSKSNSANDSVKFARLLMPQGSRGSKNSSSKIDTKEKQANESKSKALRSGKPPIVSGRTFPQKDNLLTSANANIGSRSVKNSISNEENESGQQKSMEFESSSNTEVGEMVFSSKPLPPYAPKRLPSAKAKSERTNKGKFVSGGGKSTRVEVKDRSVPEVVEPRRSNRRIQPTSRLLEGLQSSLIISKIPASSHEKSQRSQNRGTSKGN